jgi:hypothetical protein
MAYTISLTQKMRASEGGKAWRCYRFDHAVAGSMEVSAASLDLTYIECVIGEHSGVTVAVDNIGSAMLRMGVSILAGNGGLRWIGSTEAVIQHITVVGW